MASMYSRRARQLRKQLGRLLPADVGIGHLGLRHVPAANSVGVIVLCMVHVNVPPDAVKIVQKMQSRNLPAAAQNGGVLVLDAAAKLKGRNYSISPALKGSCMSARESWKTQESSATAKL